MKKSRIVRIKTEQEFLNSGWEYKSNMYLIKDDEPAFPRSLNVLFGKIIEIEDDGYYNKYTINDGNFYSISDGMIKEYLEPKDYPEYFIWIKGLKCFI